MKCNNQKQLDQKANNIRYLLKVLGERSMTAADIIEESFMNSATAHRYLKELKKNHVIYVSGYEGNFKKYSVGNKPDVSKVKVVRVKEVKIDPPFVPKPDIAAAWMFNPVE